MNTYESKRIPSLLHTPNKFNRNTLNNIGNEAWVRSDVYCTQPCTCGTRNSGSDTENSVPFVSSTTNRLEQFREIIVVYCERHTKHKDGLWTECTAHNDKPLRSIVNP